MYTHVVGTSANPTKVTYLKSPCGTKDLIKNTFAAFQRSFFQQLLTVRLYISKEERDLRQRFRLNRTYVNHEKQWNCSFDVKQLNARKGSRLAH